MPGNRKINPFASAPGGDQPAVSEVVAPPLPDVPDVPEVHDRHLVSTVK